MGKDRQREGGNPVASAGGQRTKTQSPHRHRHNPPKPSLPPQSLSPPPATLSTRQPTSHCTTIFFCSLFSSRASRSLAAEALQALQARTGPKKILYRENATLAVRCLRRATHWATEGSTTLMWCGRHYDIFSDALRITLAITGTSHQFPPRATSHKPQGGARLRLRLAWAQPRPKQGLKGVVGALYLCCSVSRPIIADTQLVPPDMLHISRLKGERAIEAAL
eukprot:scaffold5946_cov114-Isochrysis_galbana.AAC.4